MTMMRIMLWTALTLLSLLPSISAFATISSVRVADPVGLTAKSKRYTYIVDDEDELVDTHAPPHRLVEPIFYKKKSHQVSINLNGIATVLQVSSNVFLQALRSILWASRMVGAGLGRGTLALVHSTNQTLDVILGKFSLGVGSLTLVDVLRTVLLQGHDLSTWLYLATLGGLATALVSA